MSLRRDYRSQIAAMGTTDLLGSDPRRSSEGLDVHNQRILVATTIADLHRNGKVDPFVLMQQLVAGLCFLADNHGVSRANLAEMVHRAQMPKDRSLLWTPPSFGTRDGDKEG